MNWESEAVQQRYLLRSALALLDFVAPKLELRRDDGRYAGSVLARHLRGA